MKNKIIYFTQKTLVSLLVFIFIVSCSSSSKLMNKGNYDASIQKSTRKLNRKKQNDKEVVVLEKAYAKANERDRERVLFLKKEGRPENWEEIFLVYSKMSQRQENIKSLLPLNILSQNRDADFNIVNYSDEIIQAKKTATEYFYVHALSLLNNNNKSDSRRAYSELLKVKAFSNNYKEIDTELARAKNMGTSYVLFKMKNTTGIPLPPSFEDELTKISLTELNSEWLSYHTHETNNLNYDYVIVVNMKNINVSPESIKESNFTETKVVPDGFEYILDANGNVKKDSSGRDLKKPKTKTISCNVIETIQNKKSIIAGTLDYINNSTGQLIKTDPIASENVFYYISFLAIGDINALKPETKANLGKRPMPFPSGFDMLLQAGQILKNVTKNIIYNNKAVLY